MKQIRKIILSASMLLMFSIAAFAESGFEAILNVPFGASIGIPPKSMKDYFGTSEAGVGFDSGVSAQLGYMIQAGDTTAVSILAEVGYAYDTVSFRAKLKDELGGGSFLIASPIHSLQVGLLPKFNINGLSIGIGGGVKIPMAMSAYYKIEDNRYDSMNGKTDPVKFNMNDIKNIFKPQIIGYIKLTFDYSIFLSDFFAINTGVYLGYDFMPKTALYTGMFYTNPKEETSGTFDVGVQVGLRFGPQPY